MIRILNITVASPRTRSHSSSGFTLLELLLVLAVVAILVSMAVPNYQRVMAQRAVDRTALQLRDHMELARSYAQTHQIRVILCPVAEDQLDAVSPQCIASSSNWMAWVVKTDQAVLARSQHVPEGVTIDAGTNDTIVFNERGGANGYADTVVVERGRAVKSVIVASDGRIQLINDKSVNRAAVGASSPPVYTLSAPK